MWTTLNFGGNSKTDRTGRRYLQRTPDIEFEQDWSVGLGDILADGQKFKKYFSSLKDFSEKILKSFKPFLRKSECLIFPYVNYRTLK